MKRTPLKPYEPGPASPGRAAPLRATYILDHEGRVIETNEMLTGFAFCRQSENPGSQFTLRVDHDSARILSAFFRDPGESLTGKVEFCFMRGEDFFFPTSLSIQALTDAGVVVGFVVHVEPAPGAAHPQTPSLKGH